MKRTLLFLLILLPLYLVGCFYFLDKYPMLCPIEYQRDIVVRNDGRGDGFFAARRGNGSRLHNGIDLYAEKGTPVLAARGGWVAEAANNNGMGKYIIIRHPGNITTLYGHLSEIFVSEKQFVRQGQIIGAVGKTGNANYRDIEPHLHFEVRKDGAPQDPLQYLE